jgi:glycosyltransferase involved in cell wall biosynthesis
MLTTAHPYDDVRIYHKQAKTLAKAGWQVEIINRHFEGIGEEGVRFRRILLPEGRAGRMLLGAGRALAALNDCRADICVLHDPELLWLIAPLRRRGIAAVFDAHEDYPQTLKTKQWIPPPLRGLASKGGAGLLRIRLPQADAVMAATEPIARHLGQRAVLVRNRVTREDCLLFDEAARRFSPLERAVCYAGAISAQRGIVQMIQACHMAGALLLLAGQFESDALRRNLESMPQYSCVRYRGVLGREGIASLYALSNAGLLLLSPTPAYRQSEPIKLFEYLCAGLPVIASDFDHWRLLVPQQMVEFVPWGDVPAAARAIARVLDAAALRDMARQRREEMRRQFGFAGDRQRLLSMMEELGERRHQHPAD